MNRSRLAVTAAAGTGLVALTGVFAVTSHDQSTAAPQSHPSVTDQPTVPSPDQLPPWDDGRDDDRTSGAWPPATDATPATPGADPTTSSRGS